MTGCPYHLPLTSPLPPNAAVQRPRDQLSSAGRVHNEMTHTRRARADVSRSAATACYAARAVRHIRRSTAGVPARPESAERLLRRVYL